MIKKSLIVLALVVCLGLSACDSGNDRDEEDMMQGQEVDLPSRFGSRFADIFNQPVTADPVNAQPGDAGMLDFSAEPIAF